MTSTETIKQAVMANLGIALISKIAVEKEINQGSLVNLHIPSFPIIRQWSWVHPIKRRLSPAAEIIKKFLILNKKNLLKSEKSRNKLFVPT